MDVVTGAFSYTGRAIAEELLRRGRDVRTLTRRPAPRDPLAVRIEQEELQFRDESALGSALMGVDTLYNTYWIRFPHDGSTYERAIANTQVLLRAARDAGVRRIVHVSVTKASLSSPLPYFRGKAQLEQDVGASGVSFAIVRPTLVFGPRDILVNNIAWCVRRAPVFPVAGDGGYDVQPVSVEDVASICADAAEQDSGTRVDAAGPERLTFAELVSLVAAAVGRHVRVVHAPEAVVLALARAVGVARRDVMLTAEELAGLHASLLTSDERPLGNASFRSWVAANGESLGRGYVSELARNFRPYDPL
jgi:uncharacterized protein YbjT (DUF2867 family)